MGTMCVYAGLPSPSLLGSLAVVPWTAVMLVAVNSKLPPPPSSTPDHRLNDVDMAFVPAAVKRPGLRGEASGLACCVVTALRWLFIKAFLRKQGVQCVVHTAQPHTSHMAMVGRW